MRMTSGVLTALLTFALSVAAAPPVHASDTGHTPSTADIAAYRNFKLTDEFFDRYMAVEDDIAKDPCRLGMIGMLAGEYKNMSLDEAAAHWDTKPGVHAMLASHDITAKQMILGFGTLMSAAFQDLAQKYPKMSDGNGPQVSEANMAFYRSHKAEIRKFSRERMRRQMQTHGGKISIPSCMKNMQQ